MKKLFVSIFTISLLFSCNKNTKTTDKALDQKFDKYKEGFVTSLWKINPGWASGVGYHKLDSILVVPDATETKVQLDFANTQLDSLKQYDIESLSDNNKTDFQMIKNQLEASVFSIKELKSSEWNPSEYNVCGSFAEILNGNYDSLEVRLRAFNAKMNAIPAYYEAAKKNIKNPTIEHTDLAIAQNIGGSTVFEADLNEALAKSKLSAAEKKEIQDKAKVSIKAIKDYAEWLQNLPNKTPRSFRLGADLYAKKFNFDIQSSYTADEIYKIAVDHKNDLHDKMFVLADKLWKKYKGNAPKPADKLELIKQVIDKISLQHTTPERFQSEIEKQIPELAAYVKAKDLLYIDPSKPLVVRKEPAYMAGVAGASISAAGPYDKNANTYYNVGSMSGWTAENAESYLREYNDYILQILNIHEAIPGHYTQLVYSNQSPSIIKSILGNGAMVEGWAVYAEKMMLESGYKNSDEMWLMYYKWNLRTTCNTILDISVHTKDMSKEEAMILLTREAFQQQAEAEGKWKRVTLSQVQLCSYFTGYTEIYNLREELKKQEGDKFNLKKFHEKFLSFGSAPVKYIKELMLSKE
ncbi:Uncharacterized conserved protein, DUF885 familyt [Flavobacterium aquidurense]|uniref:DUF885 domain-containing protein n=1 Tax=Flavobacterium frigidimaris TaxID=262320 RepID=A0ABX4BUM5_FLAFR|nr:DUF885 domain-containing protein [Flavobacterium frigidimaris]OXA81615.1 hypothetical protein B0A65_02430 [Flavobacterium frigidimaris]SDZ53111.1 Uncharacterized conserved protein, DUF885 familyt [Flavobacterium aquidurense]